MTAKIRNWWLFALIGKMVLAAILPLSADESYYWVWSKNLQLSYFDHPAMVSWLFKLGQPFEFLGQAVRWPAVLMGHLTLLIWILILRPFMREENLFYWVLLAIFAPLIGFGSLIVTPDLPVLFFWSLAILALLRVLDNPNSKNSLLLGAALGLGFCAKYQIVLFVPCAIAYLFFEKLWSKVKVKSLLIVIISGGIFSLPVLIWNYQNDFSSFLFQLNHGLVREEWLPFWSYSYVIGQIFLIFPIPLWLASRANLKSKERILIYFSWGPLLFFFFSSFRALVEMNWPIIGYHSFYAIAAIGAASIKPIRWTVGIWLAAAALVVSQCFFPWNDSPPDKLREIQVYDQILPLMQTYQPFFAETYQMASVLWYRTKKPVYKLREMSRHDFYDELPQAMPTTSVFYMVAAKYAGFPEWIEDEGYEKTIVKEVDNTFLLLRFEKK